MLSLSLSLSLSLPYTSTRNPDSRLGFLDFSRYMIFRFGNFLFHIFLFLLFVCLFSFFLRKEVWDFWVWEQSKTIHPNPYPKPMKSCFWIGFGQSMKTTMVVLGFVVMGFGVIDVATVWIKWWALLHPCKAHTIEVESMICVGIGAILG